MQRRFRSFARVFLLLAMAAPMTATAQSDILLQLRSGSPLGDRGRFDSAGGFVALGTLGVGIIPASGAGSRMMWHPYKAAFRAGGVNSTQFDDSNIGFYSWAGGYNSRATGYGSFAFGDGGLASSSAAVSFGTATEVTGSAGFGAGASAKCSGLACISIGYFTNAAGQGAIALGYRTTADADYAVAIGQRASANGHTGAVVFGDASTTDSIQAVANNEFAVRAAGGFRFRTNATLSAGCNLPAGSGTFSCTSTRTVKHGFRDVGGEEVLGRLKAMPITSWIFNDEPSGPRHLGPVAEDFYAAFGLGSDDKTVGLNDLSGVALAAAKALEARTAELNAAQETLAVRTAKLELLEGELVMLRATQRETATRLERLEAALARSSTPSDIPRAPAPATSP